MQGGRVEGFKFAAVAVRAGSEEGKEKGAHFETRDLVAKRKMGKKLEDFEGDYRSACEGPKGKQIPSTAMDIIMPYGSVHDGRSLVDFF